MNQIGPFQILDKIGEGGMATVFKARRSPLSAIVALKLMKKSALSLPDIHARFLREARIMARLSHPNIISFFERGNHEGIPYIVTEYADQGDLRSYLANRPLSLKRRINIICDVCCGLEAAHRIGIIHRDIKPGNILIFSQTGAKLSDFGIATALWSDQTRLTQTSDTLGTLDYIAPEQRISPGQVDFRSDHYAIGVILYELSTRRKSMGFFRPPKQISPAIPERLNQLIISCLSLDPQDRYPSTTALRDDLREIVDELPDQTEPATTDISDVLGEAQHDTLPGIEAILREFESLSMQQKLTKKQHLIQQLKQLPSSAILMQLDSQNGLAKESLIEALIGRSDPEICQYMIDLLTNPYYNEKAVLVLAEQNCRQAEESLLSMLTSKRSYSYLAIRPLGRLQSHKAVTPISQYLNHDLSWIRALAIDALAEINRGKCRILIAHQAKKDPDPENRAKAQHLLRRL